MSKSNPLGLIANYGDSDDELDEPPVPSKKVESVKGMAYPGYEAVPNYQPSSTPAGIHPAPIAHCPWSACYDENSGFTYYWNQQTNAVTWEAPPEYLLALKLAQQQLHTSGSTEVSAEEWQLYQQALAEKQNSQNKVLAKCKTKKPYKIKDKNVKNKKRSLSDDEEEKIELITSFHNSDSESNDDSETSKINESPLINPKPNNIQKNPQKKLKTKSNTEFGPPLPPSQNYTVPIGPELPPELTLEVKEPEKLEKDKEDDAKSVKSLDDDSQDETILLKRLKDKAKLLEKLGGEIPSELQKIIKDESNASSPKDTNLDIDDLLDEIEKKEFKTKAKTKNDDRLNANSITTSPKGDKTPPLDDFKTNGQALFPSSINIDESKELKPESNEKERKENVYLMDTNEHLENVNKKKLRISNSVLPERKKEKIELPSYTTKYSQFIEGFSNERTGLGFSKDEDNENNPKNTINYGNGLTFTKGETLNEEKKDEDLDDLTDLVEAKLKFLNQLQPCVLTPLQEMLIQMQTLVSAFRAGALSSVYWRRWALRAARALQAHEAAAAPPGWHAAFNRSEGRYCYRRESDGFVQYEYPAVASTDMEICTTPPHPTSEVKDEEVTSTPATSPPRWWRATPPPPGTDADVEPPPPKLHESKHEITDELLSFYNDIAQLDQEPPATPDTPRPPDTPRRALDTPRPPLDTPRTHIDTPRPPPPPIIRDAVERPEKERERDSKAKKKSKVKLSTSLSMKNKSVSSLVAKWQQVADEIHSD